MPALLQRLTLLQFVFVLKYAYSTAGVEVGGSNLNMPSWCVLVCHYRPNHGHNPNDGQLNAHDVPAEMCTHMVYESAVIDADMKAKPRNSKLEVYQSGPRFYARMNKLKQRYASLATLIAVDFPTNEQFQDSLSFYRYRTVLINSIVSLIEDNNFDGVVLNLPNVNQLSSSYVNLANEMQQRRSDSFLKKSGLSWIVASIPRRHASRNGKILASLSGYLDMLILASDENNGTYAAYAVDPIRKPSRTSLDNSVESVLNALTEKGVQISNLVLGLSLRPHLFTLRETSYQQIGSPAIVDSPKLITYPQVCGYNAHISVDRRSMIKSGVVTPGRWISYNDEEMVMRKTEWLQERGFRGLSLNPINADDTEGICHPHKGAFPLLRTAFDNLHCLDMSMPMYEEVAMPVNEPLTEKLDEVPCVRLCSINYTRLKPEHDLSPALHGGCTHLVIGAGSFTPDGNLVVDDPLKRVIRSWKLTKSKTTALLLTIDGNVLSGIEYFTDKNKWFERTEKVMDQLGLDGISVSLDLRHGHIPIGVDHMVERLSAKLHKIKNYGNGLKKLLIISTTVDTLYARQIDWVRLSKFADFLSVGGTMDMMLGDDFSRILRDYYIDRHKLLLGVDAPVSRKYHYEREWQPESTEEICKRFTDNSEGSIPKHDTISSVRRKARFATMKNFAGVSLSNLESDDPAGVCHLGNKFPMLHTVLDNQLCDKNCQKTSLLANCRANWRVQCYYEPDVDGLRSRFDSKTLLNRCTHLAVVGFQLTLSSAGGIVVRVSINVEKMLDELHLLRAEANVSLVAVVFMNENTERLNALLNNAINRDKLIDEIIGILKRLNFDGVELHIGELFATDRRRNVVPMLRTLRQRLNTMSSQRSCAYEVSYATESESLQTHMRSFVEDLDQLFDYVNLLSFKHRMSEIPHPEVINRLSIDDVINQVTKAGLPKSKILLALPLFGTHYELLPGARSPVDSYEDFALYRNLKLYNATGYRTMRQVCTSIVQKRMRKGICLDSIIAYAYNKNELLVHESPETMLLKTRYARVKQLRGIALYTLNMDDRGVVCTGEPYPMLSAATLDSK